VTVCGPSTLIPRKWHSLDVEATWDLDKAIKGKDIIIVLRIQLERMQSSFFPSIREYVKYFGLNKERFERARDDAIIMHPGPVNRGWEITDELVDCEKSMVLQQVESGVAVRMAVLYLLSSAREKTEL
jgi:aspartate carbamoyltransferase catalytic subunit